MKSLEGEIDTYDIWAKTAEIHRLKSIENYKQSWVKLKEINEKVKISKETGRIVKKELK